MENKKIRKQVCLDLAPEMHKALKITAAKYGVTQNYLLCSLLQGLLVKEGFSFGEESNNDAINL